MSRRTLIGFAAVVLVALVAGVFLGLSLRHETTPVKPKAAFVVSSRRIHRTRGKIDLRLLSGAMVGANRFPIVFLDHGNASPPEALDLGDANDGPLKIVEATMDGDLTALLESRHGYFYALVYALDGPFVTEMGRKLDPEHLPSLPRKGVAVPVSYGAGDKRRAVILVAQNPRYSWHVLGFLDGYSVSNTWSPSNERPLVDAGGSYFRIDAPARRLKRISNLRSRKRRWDRMYQTPQTCIPWPARTGIFLGCPVKIQVSRAGVRSTIYEGSTKCGTRCYYQPMYQPVIPSPSGRRLLVGETDVGPGDCSFSTTSFLRIDRRRLIPIDPGHAFNGAWPLGWFDENDALIGADGPGGECSPPPSGIWVVDPRHPALHEQVLQTTSTDATIWRSN